jgi:hypothetical protein
MLRPNDLHCTRHDSISIILLTNASTFSFGVIADNPYDFESLAGEPAAAPGTKAGGPE